MPMSATTDAYFHCQRSLTYFDYKAIVAYYYYYFISFLYYFISFFRFRFCQILCVIIALTSSRKQVRVTNIPLHPTFI